MNKVDDSTTTGTNGTDQITSVITGGTVAKVNKFPDYFTTALPGPQKGPNVTFGEFGDINVTINPKINKTTPTQIMPIEFQTTTKTVIPTPAGKTEAFFLLQGGMEGAAIGPDIASQAAYKSGLEAIIPANTIPAVTIRDLRLAAATQQVLELDARSGTRYVEMIEAQFGVISDDARQQRPEFLGAIENVLNNIEVAQTSEGTTTSPQANLSAFSKTGINNELFKKSFTEHGHIVILACVRTNHTYGQGTERQ